MKTHADRLADVLLAIEDLKIEAKAVIDEAAEQGINVKALRRVARELVMDSVKLSKQLDDEHQLELFRSEVGLLQRKGLSLARAA